MLSSFSEIFDVFHIRFDAGHSGRCHTPPGHILHIIVSGHYELRINQHQLQASAGEYILYHDIEFVEWLRNDVPVEFYSICFKAPQLPLLPYEQRVQAIPPIFLEEIPDLYLNYIEEAPNSFLWSCYLSNALQHIYKHYQGRENTADSSWSELEINLRRANNYRPSLQECCEISGLSPASLNRACQETHQQSPMQRLRFIRMLQAQSLLRFSNLNISEIARHLNYPRVHEFSREFKTQCQQSPNEFRKSHVAKH